LLQISLQSALVSVRALLYADFGAESCFGGMRKKTKVDVLNIYKNKKKVFLKSVTCTWAVYFSCTFVVWDCVSHKVLQMGFWGGAVIPRVPKHRQKIKKEMLCCVVLCGGVNAKYVAWENRIQG
jgi:hypothetical protein